VHVCAVGNQDFHDVALIVLGSKHEEAIGAREMVRIWIN
jgi:hypothetical protein